MKSAIFTICKNEKTFLPIWYKYYTRFFDPKDIYVLDHQSNDGSTDIVKYNRIIIENELAFDHSWVTNTVKSFQRKLLEEYDVVIFTEIDEIIFHKDGLDSYLRNFTRDFVRCNGYDIIHMPDEDSVLDLSRSVLEQRKYWFCNHTFQAKPSISKIPLNYTYGFHSCHEGGEIDPELYMLHLNRFDYNLAYERNLDRQKFKMHEGDKAAGYGFQKHLQGEEFRNWFYNFRFEAPIVEIPEWVRKLNLV